MENYNKLRRPPPTALRTIKAGRLKGKSDINPQWRYEAMTEVYGPCGTGWKFTIDRLWNESGATGAVFAFAQISLYVKDIDWSAPIPGIGGHQLIVKESAGLHNNDEAFKMAVTDALSTAMKMLGVAADIYAGLWDGAKYVDAPAAKPATKTPEKPDKPPTPFETMIGKFATAKAVLSKKTGSNEVYYAALDTIGVKHANEIKVVADGNKLLAEFRTFLAPKKEAATFPPEEEIPH